MMKKDMLGDLEKLIDGECSALQEAEIRAELERDPAGVEALGKLERLNQLVRSQGRDTVAPEDLRRSVETRFALEDGDTAAAGRSAVSRRGILVGAGGLLAAGVAAFALIPGLNEIRQPETDPVATFFRDFETYLLGDRATDVAEANMVRLAGWFSRRLPFSLPPFGSSGGGARLVGGRLCWLLERRLASLSYDTDDGPLVVYVMRAEGIDLPASRKQSDIGEQLSWHRSSGSTSLVWKADELLIVMVGTQEVHKLMSIARALVG